MINYQVVTKFNVTIFILPLQVALILSKEVEIIEEDKALAFK